MQKKGNSASVGGDDHLEICLDDAEEEKSNKSTDKGKKDIKRCDSEKCSELELDKDFRC